MKILLVSLFVLLVSIGVQAEPLATLDSIRAAVLTQLNAPTAGTSALTTATVNDVINQCALLISTRLPAVEKMDTVTGDPDAIMYALRTDFVALAWVVKQSGDSMLVPLEYTVVDSLYQKGGGAAGLKPDYDNVAQPRFAYVFDSYLFLVPKPQYNDEFLVGYFAIATPMTTGSATCSLLPEYRQTLLNFACARLAAMQGNYTQAMFYVGLLPAQLKDEVALVGVR